MPICLSIDYYWFSRQGVEAGFYEGIDSTTPTICNQVSESWLKNTTKEDKENLTVSKDGKLYICNRSCPPDKTACGLNDKGIANGVM